MNKWNRLLAVAGALLLLGQGAAFGQAQSKDQQGCINAMNKDGAKVAATQGKENTSCIKNAGKGKEPQAQDCLTRDGKGKVSKATSKISADFDKKCTAETPDFGLPGVFSGTTAAVARAGFEDEILLVGDVFGNPLDDAIDTTKDGSKCQSAVSKDYEKTFATYMKGFLKCKKNALKTGGSESNLEACVLDDPGGKAASTIGKLGADVGKKCTQTGNIFPGLCSGEGLSTLPDCIGTLVRCRVCRTQNAMDGLHANCDALDDGEENGSCAAGRANECVLASTSSIELSTALGPLSLSSAGSIDVAIGASEGSGPASCNVRDLDPVDVAGIGFVCINEALGCDAGEVDCDGGSPKGVTVDANRNIGTCTDNADCLSQCLAECGASAAEVLQSGCEGFCSGDNPPNQECTLDANCFGNGGCNGQDGVPAGNICECQCTATIQDSAPPGGLQCNLGVALTVESASPCDGADVLIEVGTTCVPLTTTAAFGIINNANANPGATLGPFVANGSSVSCLEQDANSTSGMSLVGSNAFFASTIGDILSGLVVDCQ